MALRDEIVFSIAFVLRLRIGKQLKRTFRLREEADAQVLAEKIVAHLERCRIRFSQEPPARPHSTPGPRAPDSDPPDRP
jgi:hypothetical protein